MRLPATSVLAHLALRAPDVALDRRAPTHAYLIRGSLCAAHGSRPRAFGDAAACVEGIRFGAEPAGHEPAGVNGARCPARRLRGPAGSAVARARRHDGMERSAARAAVDAQVASLVVSRRLRARARGWRGARWGVPVPCERIVCRVCERRTGQLLKNNKSTRPVFYPETTGQRTATGDPARRPARPCVGCVERVRAREMVPCGVRPAPSPDRDTPLSRDPWIPIHMVSTCTIHSYQAYTQCLHQMANHV